MYSKHKEALSSFLNIASTISYKSCIESVSEPFDILTNYGNTWPNNELAGVYLLISESFELLYVGKSSFLGSRFNQHFHYSPNKKYGVPVTEEARETRYIISIGLSKGYEWLAPSLEEYLISMLKPVRNKIGNF